MAEGVSREGRDGEFLPSPYPALPSVEDIRSIQTERNLLIRAQRIEESRPRWRRVLEWIGVL
jgi:hypothetical protein